MLCIGDLNNIMLSGDKNSPRINVSRMQRFNQFVKRCDLFDLGFNGPAYTWCNKRFASHPIFERLDRCLANAGWCDCFPNTNVYNLSILLSDHVPILTITDSNFKRPPSEFLH
ncbi:hypothetical protein BRADI_3g35462v3 [Brachypodium distachyon]|uniref:Endonuclease/exonuclease/phosphatase domain-containing protein n=1 Tax=Brachypodium distachyon TaxID=15368 RepID=A0A2K2D1B4_BRADI|nr:hypothetical protein BRADI_3g35462v3 [Brachypodium distachyon]